MYRFTEIIHRAENRLAERKTANRATVAWWRRRLYYIIERVSNVESAQLRLLGNVSENC